MAGQAGGSIGKIYAELDLDADRYTQGQKRLLKDATSTTLNIEKNFKNLHIKSAAEMDLMRAKIENSYQRIKNSSQVTSNDIMRAEKAKAEQLAKIDEMQFGKKFSLIEKLKKNWVAAAAVVVAAWYAVSKAISTVWEVTKASARYETLGVVMRVVGNNAGYTGEQMRGFQKDLEKSGIAMIESRTILTRMAQAQIDLTNAQKLGRIAQDAAVIGNLNSSQAFEQLIYGIQSANVRVLRTIGINVDFEQSYKKLAAQLGKTTEGLGESEKAAARVNSVMEAGNRIAGTYEAAMETAGKQLLSLQRYLDNLKVLAGTVFRPIMAEAVEFVTGKIKGMNKSLELSQDDMIDFGNQIRLTMIDAEIELLKVRQAIEKVKDAVDFKLPIPPKLRALIEAFKALYGVKTVAKIPNMSGEVEVLWKVAQLQNEINDLLEKQENIKSDSDPKNRKRRKDALQDAEQNRIAAANEAKALQKQSDLETKIAENTKAAAEKIAKARLSLNEKLREDTRKTFNETGEYYYSDEQKSVASINRKRDEYEKLGADRIWLEEWVQSRLASLAMKETDRRIKEITKQRLAFEAASREWMKLATKTADAMEQSFSDLFFDAMTNQLKRLDEYVKSFLESLAREFANYYAKLTRQWIVREVVNAAGTGEPGASYMDYGATPSSSSSIGSAPVRSTTIQTTNNISQSSQASQPVVNKNSYYISAMDSTSFFEYCKRNPGAIVSVVGQNIKDRGALRNVIKTNT
ncbi:MAG TPA: hypothetical protein VKA27_04815 [Sunxiuqinia sp.]|nr:hypothetical protein [Sunxiuqinia sp.]